MIGPNIDMIPFEIEATKDTVTLSEWKNWIRGLNNTPPNVKPNPSKIDIKIQTKIDIVEVNAAMPAENGNLSK